MAFYRNSKEYLSVKWKLIYSVKIIPATIEFFKLTYYIDYSTLYLNFVSFL